MRENKTCPDQEWKQLPTKELDLVLQAELKKEHPNEEVVLPILRILEEREKDYPADETPEVLAMLEKLNKRKTSSKQSKNRRGWVAGIAAVAAAACIIVMALPRTVGAESIFDVLFRWTGEVFEFFTPHQDATNPPVDYLFETDNPGLQQLYDKVTEYGITDPVVPMWLPDGFELVNFEAAPVRENGYKVNTVFEWDKRSISVTYRITNNITTKFEKDETVVEIYDYENVSHFVLENGENISVTWTIDGVECAMNTNMAKKDIYTIIRSIYRRHLE